MKHLELALIVLTFGLSIYFYRKGEKSNIGVDGKEVEPLTFEGKLMKGIDLTVAEIKEKINPAKAQPIAPTSNLVPSVSLPTLVEYVGDVPGNSEMMNYANSKSSFTVVLKKQRGLFTRVN